MLGKRIHALRLERGWSAAETATRMGVEANQVERWEAGEEPGTGQLIALAALFGVTTDFLLDAGQEGISLEGLPGTERKILRRLVDAFDEQKPEKESEDAPG